MYSALRPDERAPKRCAVRIHSMREAQPCSVWWGGRAVECTGLENRQTRQGLEGSNPSPTVPGSRRRTNTARTAVAPCSFSSEPHERRAASLALLGPQSRALRARDEVFTLPRRERANPSPTVPGSRDLSGRRCGGFLWCGRGGRTKRRAVDIRTDQTEPRVATAVCRVASVTTVSE